MIKYFIFLIVFTGISHACEVGFKKSYYLNEGFYDQVQYEDCNDNDLRKLELVFKNLKGKVRTQNLSSFIGDDSITFLPGHVEIKNTRSSGLTTVYKATTDLRAFQTISQDQLVKTQIETNHPENFLDSKEALHFYKTNKPLKEGDFIKLSSLSEKNLVRAGQLVNVTFLKRGLRIKTQALSRQSGGLNKTIEIYNTKTKKKYNAKITNFNEVEIKL